MKWFSNCNWDPREPTLWRRKGNPHVNWSCGVLHARNSLCEKWGTKDCKRCRSPQIPIGHVLIIFILVSFPPSTEMCYWECPRKHWTFLLLRAFNLFQNASLKFPFKVRTHSVRNLEANIPCGTGSIIIPWSGLSFEAAAISHIALGFLSGRGLLCCLLFCRLHSFLFLRVTCS